MIASSCSAPARRQYSASRRSSPPLAADPVARKRRSRTIWSTLGGVLYDTDPMAGGQEQHAESSLVAQARATAAAAGALSRKLPSCKLVNSFSSSGSSGLIPPSFYPGQTIPSALSLVIEHGPPIPLALRPTLIMSLVGRVEYSGQGSRTIVNISTPLDEGIRLWVRDASRAAAKKRRLAGLPGDTRAELSLPQGSYLLPLSVQVPSGPELAPTFDIDGASFRIVYEFQVTLSCDHPDHPGGDQRILVASSTSPFELLPATNPVRRPTCPRMSVWVNGHDPTSQGGEGAHSAVHRKENARWTVQPELPTTTYSPSELIPVTLTFTPPRLSRHQTKPIPTDIVVRVSLFRREHCHVDRESLMDSSGRQGLVSEIEVVSRWGWFRTDGSCEIRMEELAMPLLAEGSWAHGYTTLLRIAKLHCVPAGEPIAVGSTFHLAITVGFNAPCSSALFTSTAPNALTALAMGDFSPTLGPSHPDFVSFETFAKSVHCSLRTLPIAVVIGSVAEPSLSPVLGTPHGDPLDGEDVWFVPPPGYEEALKQVPYEH